MTDPSSVLARIDAEVEAWEYGLDAARWRPDGPAPQPELDALVAAMEMIGRRCIEVLTPLLAVFSQLGENITAAHKSALPLSRWLSLEPRLHGWDDPCSCHPAPFPAARDYRRRTKRRNHRTR